MGEGQGCRFSIVSLYSYLDLSLTTHLHHASNGLTSLMSFFHLARFTCSSGLFWRNIDGKTGYYELLCTWYSEYIMSEEQICTCAFCGWRFR